MRRTLRCSRGSTEASVAEAHDAFPGGETSDPSGGIAGEEKSRLQPPSGGTARRRMKPGNPAHVRQLIYVPGRTRCSFEHRPSRAADTLGRMDFWDRGRELDRRLLRWMWDDDAKLRWWVWLIPAAALGAQAWSRAAEGRPGIVFFLIGPAYCIVMAVLRLAQRRKADG